MPISGIDHTPGPLAPDPSSKHVVESRDLALNPIAKPSGADHRLSPLRDRVEISEEARTLSSQSIGPVGAPSDVGQIDGVNVAITAERVQSILQRLQDGFYDHPQVQGQVAERALPDVQSTLT
jgi:hypothetical protein